MQCARVCVIRIWKYLPCNSTPFAISFMNRYWLNIASTQLFAFSPSVYCVLWKIHVTKSQNNNTHYTQKSLRFPWRFRFQYFRDSTEPAFLYISNFVFHSCYVICICGAHRIRRHVETNRFACLFYFLFFCCFEVTLQPIESNVLRIITYKYREEITFHVSVEFFFILTFSKRLPLTDVVCVRAPVLVRV